MKKLFVKMANVPKDKLLHVWYGLLLAVGFLLFTTYLLALGLIVTIAIGKEMYDRKSGTGTYDLYDALYTVIPVLLIGMVLYAQS